MEEHRRPGHRRRRVHRLVNHRRLHGEIGTIPPAEFEDDYYRHNAALTAVGASVQSLIEPGARHHGKAPAPCLAGACDLMPGPSSLSSASSNTNGKHERREGRGEARCPVGPHCVGYGEKEEAEEDEERQPGWCHPASRQAESALASPLVGCVAPSRFFRHPLPISLCGPGARCCSPLASTGSVRLWPSTRPPCCRSPSSPAGAAHRGSRRRAE